jgi:hypothetical protein
VSGTVAADVAAQTAAFQIVWVIVGEAASSGGSEPGRAGKHLFMAPDLVSFSMQQVTVSRVEVEPAVTELRTGERICLGDFHIRALAPNKTQVAGAPLTISVRQDHKERLALKRSSVDICVEPIEPGEYPIRFNSVLPAPDGTTRGAQIFLRVTDGPQRTASGG